LTVTRWSGPALYAVSPAFVDHTEAAVSSKANFAGAPSSWLETDTTCAPAAVEARLGASEIFFAAFFPAVTVNPSIVCVPKPGAWIVSG
jgi:hypothetical protein